MDAKNQLRCFISLMSGNQFIEWRKERIELRNEIDNLKKVNDVRVKEIEKLKKENEGQKRTQKDAKQGIKEKI